MTAPALPLPELPQLAAGARVWVGYSGGGDSTALLHRLQAAGVPNLRAVHIHHGLQAQAEDWIRHCRASCRRLGVPMRLLRVRVDRGHPGGPEAAAREARYAALRSLLKPGDLLVTAHHQDDQAETLLLRLLRGTGVAGAAAMRPLAEFPPGRLWRPLLSQPRERLRAYAQAQGLGWIEDPHNQDPAYSRSWLRAEVMPRLAARWPQAADSLARFAGHAADTATLLEALASLDLATAQCPQGLSVAALLALDTPRRHNLLRHWLATAGELPSAAWLARCDRELLGARPDGHPRMGLGTLELRRYRDTLYRMAPLAPPPGAVELPWTRGRRLPLPGDCGALVARRAPAGPLTVRFARGGERLRPVAGGPSRSLKNLFQQAGVPVWVRERTPLLFGASGLLAVGGFWQSEALAAAAPGLRWETVLPGATQNKD